MLIDCLLKLIKAGMIKCERRYLHEVFVNSNIIMIVCLFGKQRHFKTLICNVLFFFIFQLYFLYNVYNTLLSKL